MTTPGRSAYCYICKKQVTLVQQPGHSTSSLHTVCPVCHFCPDCDAGE